MNRKKHWENIYATKKITDVSWYQKEPRTAIEYLGGLGIKKTDSIIDVGGGDSFFVDYLIENRFKDISILDISSQALGRAQKRLGDDAHKINWIEADASSFTGDKKYDFWYDRAAFHFLTQDDEIKFYVDNVSKNMKEKGKMVIGTFSDRGPTKCSGVEIKQYTAQALENLFIDHFTCLSCQNIDHLTPFDTTQNFTFCCFERK